MRISRQTKNTIKNFLKNHKNFIIAAHTSPEGDSLGAQLAFAESIRLMGKQCDIINADQPSREYEFLPGVKTIRTKPRLIKYDAAIILDCSDISRIGNVVNFIGKDIPVLNIDHHISNERFGDVNFVDKDASSVCEILYLLFKQLNLKINRDIAVCLYVGIVTDTGSFRYINTRITTHYVAAELLKWGIDVVDIYRSIYQNLALSDLEFLNRALASIKLDSTGRVAWVKITRKLIEKYRPKIDLTDNILNFLRSLKDVEVCVLFRERGGAGRNIRINLRSKSKVDVNKIAQHLGGGGHRTASGVTLRGTSLKKAESLLINYLKHKVR